MLRTFLTVDWKLKYPLISAPMAGAAGGDLARAVSRAGGLGMMGVGSRTSTADIDAEVERVRSADSVRFGMGLLIWAVEQRPELLDAVVEASPFLVSLSFGDPAQYVDRLHRANIRVAAQVNSRAQTERALKAGVDLVVAQGTEAGGHTGHVATLPLLQVVLDAVGDRCPVVAAGGIASPSGLAAVLAAGAAGAWVGTALVASAESLMSSDRQRRVIDAMETDTILSRAFDVAWRAPWPVENASRTLRNRFTDDWAGREGQIHDDPKTVATLADAVGRGDLSVAPIPAGQAVGLVHEQEPAGRIVERICEGAERLLRARAREVLEG